MMQIPQTSYIIHSPSKARRFLSIWVEQTCADKNSLCTYSVVCWHGRVMRHHTIDEAVPKVPLQMGPSPVAGMLR